MRPSSLMLAMLLLAVFTSAALAQDAGTGSAAASGLASLDWSSLSGGDDWSAQVLQSLFPSASATAGQTGFTSIVGSMLGHISGYVMLLAAFYFSYSMVVQIHRVGETGKIMSETFSGWVPVRLAFAIICLVPTPSGFSLGQQLVVKSATFGIGMARNLYNIVIDGVGPDAIPIATPIIPGTKKLVLGLIEDEFCRAMANKAANNASLIPAPVFSGGTSGEVVSTATLSYGLANGMGFGAPACGSVTVQRDLANSSTVAGVPTDMSAQQKAILQNVIASDIRSQVSEIAAQFWQSRQSSVLSGLEPILVSATADYDSKLTAAATTVVAAMRANSSRSSVMQGNDADSGVQQMRALGWTSAGAYYLEIGRLNGVVLGLMSATPQVVRPCYCGFGEGLSKDLAPLFEAATQFENQMDAFVAVADGDDVPGGGAQLYAGASPAEDGESMLTTVLRTLHINERVLNGLVTLVSPTSTSWTDPFAGLIALGQKLIHIALAAIGLTALLSSKTGTVATVGATLMTGNIPAAVAEVAGAGAVKAIALPIYAGCLAMLTPGLMLAYVLPAMPFAIWFAGVCGWFVLVCEAVVAVPFWMLAHMILQGEGLHGRATAGYGLILNILFRPIFMMAGLILGYVVFGAMSWLLMRSFGIMASFILSDGYLVTNVLGVIVLICVFVAMEMKVAQMSFKLISTIPHQMPGLLGLSPAGRVDMEGFGNETAGEGMRGFTTKLSEGTKEALPEMFGKAEATGKSLGHEPSGGEIDQTLAAQTAIIPPRAEEGV